MRLLINGETTEVARSATVSELLAECRVSQPDMVSVELNGEILDRADFPTTPVREGDSVEFLYFMGGGAR